MSSATACPSASSAVRRTCSTRRRAARSRTRCRWPIQVIRPYCDNRKNGSLPLRAVKRIALIIAALWLLSAQPAFATGAGVVRAHAHRARQRMTLGVAAVRFAERFRGAPYVWAGTTPAGFDCSGFTRFVYAHFGISLPHSSYAQWALGRHVPRSQLRPGDLVFFGLGHVGIWIGAGRFIHAPHTG